jgi:DNA modification methylase
VLPKVNITKFFLRSISKRRTEEDSEPGNENSETDADAIPFPNIWHRKLIKVFIPSFNYSTPDQYGRKLAEASKIGRESFACSYNGNSIIILSAYDSAP